VLSVIKLSAVMLCVIMLNAIVLSVIMLNAVMLSVGAPKKPNVLINFQNCFSFAINFLAKTDNVLDALTLHFF